MSWSRTRYPRSCSGHLTGWPQALAAMGAGDPAPYAALWPNDPDVTLFGAWGPIERGHDAVTSTFTWVASRFSAGALVPRHDVIKVSGDLAYTVGLRGGRGPGRRRRSVPDDLACHPRPAADRRRVVGGPPARRLPAGRPARALSHDRPTMPPKSCSTTTPGVLVMPDLVKLTPADRLRRLRRHHDRVLRLLHLRHRRRARVRHGVLPGARRGRRHGRGHRDVRGGVPRPAAGLGALRSSRRPARPQADADRHAGPDGGVHRGGRAAARRGEHRRRGPDHPGRAAVRPGPRGRRRVGRRSAARGRVRPGGPARPVHHVPPARPRRGLRPDQRHVPGHRAVHEPGGVPRLGLAGAVPAQRRPARRSACTSGCGSRRPRCSASWWPASSAATPRSRRRFGARPGRSCSPAARCRRCSPSATSAPST